MDLDHIGLSEYNRKIKSRNFKNRCQMYNTNFTIEQKFSQLPVIMHVADDFKLLFIDKIQVMYKFYDDHK